MKYLLYAGILGFLCWTTSEVLEIIQGGYSPSVYYLTAAYHLLAGLGIWGLHKVQSPENNLFNKIAAGIASISYVALTYFPLEVMESGLSMTKFMEIYPVYKVLGIIWVIGMLLFGIAVISSKYFPVWAGFVIIIGTLIFIARPLLGFPMVVVNISNIFFAITIIYMSVLASQDKSIKWLT